ncbi:MAG TPA: hypothetical protein VLD19_18575, partial [Chitinophagaceae bacterium]|nr:hypothetical protein [Chitinophagaceae bacterium]
ANQLANNQWLASFYDSRGRIVSTGLITYASPRDILQQWVDNVTNISINEPPSTLQPDMLVQGRELGKPLYQATSSITIEPPPDFVSETNADFTMEIIPDPNEMQSVQLSPSQLQTGMSFYLLTENYYDNYAYASVKSFSTSYSFAYTAGTNDIETAQVSNRVSGFLTGRKVRVLPGQGNTGTNKFFITSVYYDERGRLLQSLADNIKNGVDITTNQYDFAGSLWSSLVKHMAGTAGEFSITAKNELDKLGRLTRQSKNFNNTFYKVLAEYTYDEYGKLKTKKLAPGYNGSQMELLSYDYNIQGWLTGINKNFALSTDNSDQWTHFFGLSLGYDNRDNTFAAAQYNGNITGAIWRSQGDNAVRKYDYTYDNMNRFTAAIFNQKNKPSDGWSHAEVDLSSYVQYEDGNGNIKSLKHMGIVPGVNNGVVVDDLQYTYVSVSGINVTGNRLGKVKDIAADPAYPVASNGKMNDFTDGNNPADADDYVYDDNGNLVTDLNKGIGTTTTNGIIYNFLNKPDVITAAGKYKVEYTYDAEGTKLAKKVTDLSASPVAPKTTYYIDEFIYDDNDLQMVLYGEGRMKIITPTAAGDPDRELNAGAYGASFANNKQGVFEYFIKDNLGNTRMVLTEEVQKEKFLATMEVNTPAVNPTSNPDEEKKFGQVDNNGNPNAQNELVLTRTDKPAFWGQNPTDPNLMAKVVKLSASNAATKMGPNMILKVMAGDIVSAKSDYYYF